MSENVSLPRHIGFIVDGNRRWAKQHGLPTYEGHLAGYNALKDVALEVLHRGVKYASAYVFSTENWKRSEEEVRHLMKLLLNILKADLPIFIENEVRLRVIGSREGLSDQLIKAIDEAEEKTADLKNGELVLCLNYGAIVPLENYDQALLNRLGKSREYEIATGFTSAGPHREDFTIFLHDQPAIKVASRGEMRTIMLAFKLLELEMQTETSQSRPLILLDDVFSELDATREKLLQETIQNHQFIVTTTDARHQKDGCSIISTQ